MPEFVTALSAVRKGQGGLALGNVLGADVLNLLFVSGAAAVTRGCLEVPPQFFYLFFPSRIFVAAVFRIGIGRGGRSFEAPAPNDVRLRVPAVRG